MGSLGLASDFACRAALSSRIMGPPVWPLGPDQGPGKSHLLQKNREETMPYPCPLPSIHPTDRLVGTCPALQALRAQLRYLATFDTLGNPAVPTVLLQG